MQMYPLTWRIHPWLTSTPTQEQKCRPTVAQTRFRNGDAIRRLKRVTSIHNIVILRETTVMFTAITLRAGSIVSVKLTLRLTFDLTLG